MPLEILKTLLYLISLNALHSEKEERPQSPATARKLAVIIWNMIVKGVPYKSDNDYEFLDQKRKGKYRK